MISLTLRPHLRYKHPAVVACFFLIAFLLPSRVSAETQASVAFSSFRYEGHDRWADIRHLNPGEFLNPILPGMYPDPSTVRVGGDYYLVNSTFAWYPGIPIFHSRDLVRWQQIGFVLNRPSQLDLDHMQVSEGIFAPTIRYHHGIFYLITTLMSGFHTFYVTAKNPAGPWSDPVSLPELNGIDPSFFFDNDGKAYIVHNGPPPDNPPPYPEQRAIWLVPFDLATGKVSGEQRLLINSGDKPGEKPRWIEGPHLFRHNGYYYLIAAQGGTSTGHSEVVFRSSSLAGPFAPYAKNPILTQRTLDLDRIAPIADTGHADFVEAQNGSWWAVFLGTRPYQGGYFNTGRETFLLPVHWRDDWPVILLPGEQVPRITQSPPLRPQQSSNDMPSGSFRWTDDFNKSALKPEWQTLRTPISPCWSLASGKLLLRPGFDDLPSRDHPCFLGRRQQHAGFTASITLHLENTNTSTDAGLAIFQNEHSFFFLGVRTSSTNSREIFVEQASGTASLPASTLLAHRSLPAARQIELRLDQAGAKISFSYRLAGKQWVSFLRDEDATILSTAKAGGFVGCFLGPFARRIA